MLLTVAHWDLHTSLIVLACVWMAFVWSGFMTTLTSRGGIAGSATSRCPNCRGSIPTLARLPIVGWLAARGRCAACGYRVPLAYPAIEIASFVAISFVVAAGIDVWVRPDLPAVVFSTLSAAFAVAAAGLAALPCPARRAALLLTVAALIAAMAAHTDFSGLRVTLDVPTVLIGLGLVTLWIVRRVRGAALASGLVLVVTGTAGPLTLVALTAAVMVPLFARRLAGLGASSPPARTPD